MPSHLSLRFWCVFALLLLDLENVDGGDIGKCTFSGDIGKCGLIELGVPYEGPDGICALSYTEGGSTPAACRQTGFGRPGCCVWNTNAQAPTEAPTEATSTNSPTSKKPDAAVRACGCDAGQFCNFDSGSTGGCEACSAHTRLSCDAIGMYDIPYSPKGAILIAGRSAFSPPTPPLPPGHPRQGGREVPTPLPPQPTGPVLICCCRRVCGGMMVVLLEIARRTPALRILAGHVAQAGARRAVKRMVIGLRIVMGA
jgi:hypothetical protein